MISAISEEFALGEFYLDQSKNNKDLDSASDDMLLDIIQSISQNYKDITSFFQLIDKSISDGTDIENDEPNHRDEVSLSTIHKAKGKEYENAVLLNLSQEKHKKTDSDVEEERRVAYVGVTRAKKRLLVTFMTSQPSVFIKEMALNPAFRRRTINSLRADKSKLKIEIAKFDSELKILNYKKKELLTRFPELEGEDVKLPTSFNLWNRVKLWVYEKRLASAFKKFNSLEEDIIALKKYQLTPRREKYNQIHTEIVFREILGK